MAINVYRHDGSREITFEQPDYNDWNNMLDLVENLTDGHDHDGSNSKTVPEAGIVFDTSAGHDHDTANSKQVDHTNLASIGTNAHGVIDTHLANNNQAHSDYLKNDAADTGVALTLSGATSVPLIANNSTGTQAIVKFQDNGNTIFQIDNGGLVKIADAVATPITATKFMLHENRTGTSSQQMIAARMDQEGVITVNKRIVQTGAYKIKVDGASTNGYFYGMTSTAALNHASADVQRVFGLKTYYQGLAGTTDDAGGIISEVVIGPTTVTKAMGMYVPAATITTGSATQNASFWADKQTVGTTDYGVVLNGDGRGSDLSLGAGQDASLYYDGTDLVLDPDIVGSGQVLIGATGDNDMKLNDIEVVGRLKGSVMLLEGANNVNNQTGSGYLDLHNGMVMTANRGHPMPRAGSITAVAAYVNVDSYSGGAELHMQVRKNGSEVFDAQQVIDATGTTTWSATQARGTDTFVAGDRIQIYIEAVGTVQYDLPIATVEITLDT